MRRTPRGSFAAVLALLFVCFPACRGASQEGLGELREPAVAGRFYPADPTALRTAVETYLRHAVAARADRPVAVVAPHAGYLYSGQVAADAWRQAAGRMYDLVVILGTNHTAPGFRGVAVHPGAGFRTPLGVAPIDRAAARALAAADPDCVFDEAPHAREHSVEVQLPFAQVLFPKARILPLVVGGPDPGLCERLGNALASALRGRNALIVASSDLSHYPSAGDASAADRALLAAVARLDPPAVRATIADWTSRGIPSLATCACGEGPVLAAMWAARALGASRGLAVSYANSGDVPIGEPRGVVGYGAVAFDRGPAGADTAAIGRPAAPPPGPLDAADRRALLALARESIARFATTGTVPLLRGLPPRLRRPQGAFVTLTKGGQLRGCIGRMSSDAPLDWTVAAMALQAAFRDRRFPPVTAGELPALAIDISVLTPMARIGGPGEIRVGHDGVLLEKGGRSAVFLPQIATEQGWGREELLDRLCMKAGMDRGCWKSGAGFSVFQSEIVREGEGS